MTCAITGRTMKFLKEGNFVRLVVCGPGPRRAEERVKVRVVEGRQVYIHGLQVPFSKDTGICEVTLKKGMLVMLEPDSDD
jgi:hypothetical protein